MKPLRIVFFNRAFYPEISATSQLLTELAEDLAEDYRCHVTVVAGKPLILEPDHRASRRPWRPLGVERYGRVSIVRAWGTAFSKRSFLGRVANYLSYFALACWAGRRLKRPDVVIALTDPPLLGLAAWWTARRCRCPFVISYNDLFPEVSRLLGNSRRPLIEWALEKVNRALIQRADRVVVLGEAMRKRLIEEKETTPERVEVISPWADCSALVPTEKKNSFSVKHGLSESFVVMHAGNLGLLQDFETLLKAAWLLRDLPQLLFVFVGEGVKRAELEALVRKQGLSQVRFLPFQPKEHLSETFGAADCFLVSLKPGLGGYVMPSKLYAILASGRPYVAAVDAQCDVARITQKYQCGLLACPGNAQDIAEGILSLYRDQGLCQRLGTNGRQAALLFDRPNAVKAYFELCHRLARVDSDGSSIAAG